VETQGTQGTQVAYHNWVRMKEVHH